MSECESESPKKIFLQQLGTCILSNNSSTYYSPLILHFKHNTLSIFDQVWIQGTVIKINGTNEFILDDSTGLAAVCVQPKVLRSIKSQKPIEIGDQILVLGKVILLQSDSGAIIHAKRIYNCTNSNSEISWILEVIYIQKTFYGFK